MVILMLAMFMLIIIVLLTISAIYYFNPSFNAAKTSLVFILLISIVCPFSFSLYTKFEYVLANTIRRLRENDNHINDYAIIPYYEPPLNIHPAIAGFLIDREIGKNEFFATLFNSIIKGYIAIDEKADEYGKYKYFLIKNKGWELNYDMCDRIVVDNVFHHDNKLYDEISFSDLEIKLNDMSIPINN